MKVLVINGSPKCERSDTMHITRAFVEGMGEQFEEITAVKANVGYCRGCFACWHQTPGKCVQHDDMEEILEKITSSDLVIWSMPLYCYGVPSSCKAIIDRMLPLSSPTQVVDENGQTYHPERSENPVRFVLIAGSGFPDLDGNFDAVSMQFERMFGDITMILCPESPMFNVPMAEPATKPYLEKVRQAGAEYASAGRLSEETARSLAVPMIPPEEYRRICNGG